MNTLSDSRRIYSAYEVASKATKVDHRTKSPLLFEMFEKLSNSGFLNILDIGMASSDSLDYYNQFSCRVFFHELSDDIFVLQDKLNDEDIVFDLEDWKLALDQLLSSCRFEQVSFNIVLLWDLPNYLSLEQLNYLVDRLHSPNTLLHMYIYNTRYMSMMPHQWKILQDNHVLIKHMECENIEAPGYNQSQLNKSIKNFKVDHVVMLSSGIEEYAFSSR